MVDDYKDFPGDFPFESSDENEHGEDYEKTRKDANVAFDAIEKLAGEENRYALRVAQEVSGKAALNLMGGNFRNVDEQFTAAAYASARLVFAHVHIQKSCNKPSHEHLNFFEIFLPALNTMFEATGMEERLEEKVKK